MIFKALAALSKVLFWILRALFWRNKTFARLSKDLILRFRTLDLSATDLAEISKALEFRAKGLKIVFFTGKMIFRSMKMAGKTLAGVLKALSGGRSVLAELSKALAARARTQADAASPVREFFYGLTVPKKILLCGLNLSGSFGDYAGTIDLHWNGMKGATHFIVEMTMNNQDAASWKFAVSSTRS